MFCWALAETSHRKPYNFSAHPKLSFWRARIFRLGISSYSARHVVHRRQHCYGRARTICCLPWQTATTPIDKTSGAAPWPTQLLACKMSETIIQVGDGSSDSKADMETQPPSLLPNAALPFYKLFGFADSVDMVLMILGAIGAVASGLCDPLAIILFGQLANEFGKGDITHVHATMHQVSLLCVRALYVGVVAFFASFLEAACWMCTGERQAGRIRHLYLKAILRQDIGFFDKETSTGDVIGRMSGDIVLIQAAIGEKVGNFTHLLSKFMGGFGVAFYMGWKLTVVMISATPLLVAVGSITFIAVSKLSIRGQQAYTEAGDVVEQTISTIRTVASFSGERKAVLNYKKALVGAYEATLKQGLATGLGVGLTLLVTFCTYALALWYGSRLIVAEGYSGRSVINVIFSVLIGGMSLAQAWPCLNTFAAGRAAASKMFQVIERKPEIDVYNKEGLVLADIEGDVELQDVYFNYPARPNVNIFSGLSLKIPMGTTVALVGENGSGKSTIINLIQRFYDPQRGEVLLDGHNIKQFQLKWMRQKLGLVSQEPVLFTTTIRQNIAYGYEGATMAEIKAAAELANAAKFISKLPQGFDTMVGEQGSHLSGGQKQRIAIARAVLRNPKVLLLDEATSALDAESERAVQEALSMVTINRTTIMVTHRLTTIRSSDLVAVIQRGSVIEKGTHAHLIKDPCGVYSKLVRRQQLQGEAEHPSKTPFNELTNLCDNLKPVGSVGNKEPVCEIYVSIGSPYCPISIHLLESPNVTQGIQRKEENESKSLRGLNNNSVNIGNEGNESEFSVFRLASLNKPEVPIIVLGSTAAAVNGLISPVFGLLLAKLLHSFFQPANKLQRSCDFWALMYVLLGVVSFIAASAQSYCFAIAGGRLVKRLRALTFERVLHQEMGWFDEIQNFSGAISARLAADAANVRGMVGDALSLAVQNISTIIAAIIIAFTESWELSLLILALMPLIGIQVCLQVKFMKGFSAEIKIMYEAASQVAKDAVRGIRTVASFCAENEVMDIYSEKCTVCLQYGIHKGIISGIVLGLSNFMVFGVYAVIFWVGAHLINDGKTTFSKLFTVFFALTISAIGVSQSVGQAPNISQLKLSTTSVFRILDRKSKIDPGDTSGTLLTNVKGEIEFRHVRFRYPTRPNVEIFRDLCLSVHSGKTVGLVGESGCGKSTIISLMERFYDPDSGSIFLDGVELRTVQVTWLRHQMGLVSQEPVLFNGTIRSNICYGCGEDDNDTGAISDRQIVSAARAANAHDFICNLPQGYDTRVGQSGLLLSGGQKQRIAIARAILRDPKILLLDEATSALDAESERIVQHAFDRLRIDRTTVVISHKLSTIKNADIIAVVKNGVIAEQGRHDELTTKIDGIYASLVKLHGVS